MSREPIYRPAIFSSIRSWRESAGRYRLQGTKCMACGALHFPRRQACKQCHSQDVVRYSAARTGTVTEIWPQVPLVRLSGFSALSRRHVALISLDDGLALEAEVIDIDAEAAKPGLRVEMTIRRLRRDSNGLWLYGYKFREMKTTTVEGASNAET